MYMYILCKLLSHHRNNDLAENSNLQIIPHLWFIEMVNEHFILQQFTITFIMISLIIMLCASVSKMCNNMNTNSICVLTM